MASDEIQIQLTPVSRLKCTEIEAAAKRIWPEAYSSILKPGQIEHMLEMMYSPAALSRDFHSGIQYRWIKKAGTRKGFLAYGPVSRGSSCELHKLYVEAEVRGQGIGKGAIETLTHELEKVGAKSIRLRVNRHNETAIYFYQRVGFSITEEDKLDIGGGFVMDDFLMEKPL